MTDRQPKIIIIISLVISVAILVFAAVFMHNTNEEIDAINEQISEAKLQQESILQDMSLYDKEVNVTEVKSHIEETTAAGKEVEKLQNDAIKYYNEHYDPMASVWADDYEGDKTILKQMKSFFPKASKSEQVLPWVLGWDCTWEFQSVYNYDEGGTRLCWLCKDSDNRVLAIAYADYEANSHTFDDLEIILSKHANDADRK